MKRLTSSILAAGLFPLALHAGITPGSKDLGAVWFVGDSITQSNADGDPNGSPRKSLHDLLQANSYSYTFTGHHEVNVDGLPATGGTPATNLYHYHSGISGSVIGNDVSGRVGMTQNLPAHWAGGRLASVKPNVVLVMLGTNDINSDIDRANAPARLATYLDTLFSQPGIGTPTVMVATIPPNRTTAAKPDWVAQFNAALPGIVGAQRALGRDVHFVDQFTPLETNYASLMSADNLHVNAAGNASLASRWFNKIAEIVNGSAASGTGPLRWTGAAVWAETDNSTPAGMAAAANFAGEVLSDDLINAGQPTLVSAVMDKGPFWSVAPGVSAFNDGLGFPADSAAGAYLPATFGGGDVLPFTYTLTLDTSTNRAGYKITSIRSFAGWPQNGSSLANQKYEVLVSHVGDSGFLSLGTYTYTPFRNDNTAEAAASRLVLQGPFGMIATGVDAIRLVFLDHGVNNGNLAIDGTVYHEIDVIGSAVPILATGTSVSAETDNNAAAGYPTATAFSADIVADDLINAGRPSLVSAAWDKTPFFTSDPVNDGDGHPAGSSAGTYLPATFGSGAKLPFTYTAVLNTAGAPLGYQITEVRSFAGWNQNGAALANQKYEMLVRAVGGTEFVSLGTFGYSPFDNASTQEAAASKLVLTPVNGVLASGVDAVRFVVLDHGYNSADSAGSLIDGSVYFEFDVLGAAVAIPDTGGISLAGANVAAETDNNAANGYAIASAYSADILADDLINAGRPSLASASWDKTPFFTSDPVNDGDGHPAASSAGTFLPATFGSGAKLPFTYTARLDLAAAPDGYHITGIRSFAGWNQNGAALANQKYELLVSPVGNAGFYSLGVFNYSPFDNSSTQEAAATKVVLSANDGVLASGVDAVRFVVLDHGYNSADLAASPVDGSVFFEFDVTGTAVAPGFAGWAGGYGIPADEGHDGDLDGISALLEYGLGYSPRASETLPALGSSGATPRIVWPKGAEAAVDPAIRYRVRVSDTLSGWAPPEPGELVETAGSLALDLNIVGPRRFARLEVLRTGP